ncbi:MAG: hypothetical protein AB7O92_12190 [Acidimicrobiia bacterium]
MIFPPGTYLIAEHQVAGGPHQNDVGPYVLDGLRSFVVSGYGARLSFAGGFHRSADIAVSAGQFSSYDRSIGLILAGCSEFTVEGLEIDGNADTITRDGRVVESYGSAGLATEACERYELRDLDIHHTTSDGLLIGSATAAYRRADRDGQITGVRCWANARNALSIIQATGLTFTRCAFTDAGLTGRAPGTVGSYHGHAPQASCDIEPDYDPATNPELVDRFTGDLVFDGCRFAGSVGPAFASVYRTVAGRVLLRNCTFDGSRSPEPGQVILTSPAVDVDGCRFVDAPIYGTYAGGEHRRWLSIRRSTMVTPRAAVVIAETNPQLGFAGALEDNVIVRTAGPFDASQIPVMIRTGHTPFRFLRNRVIVDGSAADDRSSPLPENTYVVALQNLVEATGNTYSTNLGPPRTLAVNYDGSSTVAGEEYVGQFRRA